MSKQARHLLQIEGMGREEIESLISRAQHMKRALEAGDVPAVLAGKVVVLAFFEDSTRTRASFEAAAKRLGGQVINWTLRGSSVAKGETSLDTARNLDALGPSVLVIRHGSSGAPHLISRHVRGAVVNAGDGTHEHPSQALLDALTLREHLGDLSGKRLLIVGDVLHSRVARSNLHCLAQLGMKVRLCGPPTLLPSVAPVECEISYQLDEALQGVDAVMMLRLQLERQKDSLFPSAREYAHLYGLSAARAATLSKQVPILHPGPMNRGVEISSDVADSPSSRILDQVANGVGVRMAILERCA